MEHSEYGDGRFTNVVKQPKWFDQKLPRMRITTLANYVTALAQFLQRLGRREDPLE